MSEKDWRSTSHKAEVMVDTGYTNVCPICAVRHGGTVFGPRTLEFVYCEKCMDKPPEDRRTAKRDWDRERKRLQLLAKL